MFSLLINILVLTSLNSICHAYTPSAWGILKNQLLKNPTRFASYCSSDRSLDTVYHMTKIGNIKSILRSGKILTRSGVGHFPEQLFKDCDCNPDVVYASFKKQQAREGKCVFTFPLSSFENYLEEQEKIDKIFISGFYNLGNFDPNFSSTVKDIDKFCSLVALPGHELVIPCSLCLGSGISLVSRGADSDGVKQLLDEYGYQYTTEQDDEEDQFTFHIN